MDRIFYKKMERNVKSFVYFVKGDGMRKTICLIFLFMFILAGCNSFHQNAMIDWVDFVKWDGIVR